MNWRRKPLGGQVYAAFGLGLFVGCCFPTRYLVLILSVSVIFAGVSICKSR